MTWTVPVRDVACWTPLLLAALWAVAAAAPPRWVVLGPAALLGAWAGTLVGTSLTKRWWD